MCEARTDRRHQHAGWDDRGKPEHVDVADGADWQALHIPAGPDKSDHTGYNHDRRQPGSCANGLLDGPAIYRQQCCYVGAAANAHERRHYANSNAIAFDQEAVGDVITKAPRVAADKQFCNEYQAEDDPYPFQTIR